MVLNRLIESIIVSVIIISWISGVIIANGIISKCIAIIFPFWSWYLVIEKWLLFNNWV